jgi:murein DD-endopeptidase MepM/ murein hydrolase activator NlpD
VTVLTERASTHAYVRAPIANRRCIVRRSVLVVVLSLAALVTAAPAASASGSWSWPVTGPVIRGYDPPDSPYGSGHRGIDVAASVGTAVVAAESGVVSFAGPVGGRLFVSVDHGSGVVSSYSYLSLVDVHKGDLVARGGTLGRSGLGHVGVTPAHLHFGVRVDGAYADPMAFLGPPSVVSLIRLAPLDG